MTSFLTRYKSHLGLLSLIFIAFISLGMPDGLLGVAWPSIQYSFSVPIDSLGMLLIAGTSGYLISSFSSGPLTSRFGIGWVLAASCFLTGFGLIGYTLVPTWWGVVALGVVAGLGAGAIDSGLNTYVAGHFGEGLMQWLHASYGIGVTLGPLVMTLGLTRFDTWRWGYAVVGTAQIALAAVFVLTLSVWKNKGECPEVKKTDQPSSPKTSVWETLKQPIVWLSILLFFLYCGAEGTMGYWTYSILTESRGITPKIAGLWAGSYWAMFTIGRIAAGLYTRRVGNDNLVRFSLFAALIGAALLWWNPFGAASLPAVAITGLAIAPIFPALVSGTSRRVSPRHAANAIGMQMGSGGLGLALIPALLGVLARRLSLEVIPVCLLVLFVLLLGLHTLSLHPGNDPVRPK